MPQVYIHHGPLSTISQTASPGLIFLKNFLPALDSLDPASSPVRSFLAPNATFIFNNGAPTPSSDILSMIESRSEMLSKFYHEVRLAWDTEKEEDGKRTVMYESTSITVFKEDPEQFEVRVREFNVIELEVDEHGVLKAVELRVFMDATPVQDHRSKLEQERSA
jgi:hypothetical protein